MDMRRVCSAHSAPGGFVLDKQAVPKGSSGFSIHFHDQCAVRIMGIARDVPSGHCCRAQLWAVSAAPAHREPPGTLETPAWGGGGRASGEGGCVGNGGCSALCHEAAQLLGRWEDRSACGQAGSGLFNPHPWICFYGFLKKSSLEDTFFIDLQKE